MGFDGSECDDALISPAVAHDADGLDWEEDGEDLAGLAVEPGRDDFFEQNLVGVADDFEFVFGDVAKYTHSEPWAWEWVSPDDGIGDAQDGAQGADFILEQLSDGFDEFEAEFFGEASDIVVEFDVGGVSRMAMA